MKIEELLFLSLGIGICFCIIGIFIIIIFLIYLEVERKQPSNILKNKQSKGEGTRKITSLL